MSLDFDADDMPQGIPPQWELLEDRLRQFGARDSDGRWRHLDSATGGSVRIPLDASGAQAPAEWSESKRHYERAKRDAEWVAKRRAYYRAKYAAKKGKR